MYDLSSDIDDGFDDTGFRFGERFERVDHAFEGHAVGNPRLGIDTAVFDKVDNAFEIFTIDPEKKQLSRIFQEGSRDFNPRSSWVAGVAGEQLLIHIAGASRVLFDPERALERMGQ